MERELKAVVAATEKIMIFVDGSNLEEALRTTSYENKDYESLFIRICEEMGGKLEAIHYFNSKAPQHNGAKDKKQNFFDIINKIPYVHPHIHERVWDPKLQGGKYRERGVDVDIATKMAILGAQDKYDIAILVSGDQDFKPLVEQIRALGKRVFICSTKQIAHKSYIGDSGFIELADLINDVDDYNPY